MTDTSAEGYRTEGLTFPALRRATHAVFPLPDTTCSRSANAYQHREQIILNLAAMAVVEALHASLYASPLCEAMAAPRDAGGPSGSCTAGNAAHACMRVDKNQLSSFRLQLGKIGQSQLPCLSVIVPIK